MPHVIRLYADERRIRAEIPSRGISLEEEAAVAVIYRRPSRGYPPVGVLAVGRNALQMTESVRIMDRSLAKTEEDRLARVVPLERAAWWNDGRLLARDARFDPTHIGEILIVRPFARKTFSPPLCEALLRYIDFSARRQAGGVLRRWYLRRLLWWTSRVEIVLQGVPDDDASHDALVRELRPYFIGSITLGGAPLRLRHPRGFADLRIIHLGQLAAIFAAGALPFTLHTGLWLNGKHVTVLGAIVALWLVIWYRKFRYDGG
ncbi:hypothetical protein [Sorangium sp. So ce204]|uniref:hypothetical protein n=1 Tax=Sorangium sp. So ce204 TaxID=3133288 RepID=UPI003F60EE27